MSDTPTDSWFVNDLGAHLLTCQHQLNELRAQRDRLQKDNDKLRIEHTELFETYAQQGLTAFKAVEEERAENDRLREALRMALPHVKSEGDDTLAMVIRAALAKEEAEEGK